MGPLLIVKTVLGAAVMEGVQIVISCPSLPLGCRARKQSPATKFTLLHPVVAVKRM